MEFCYALRGEELFHGDYTRMPGEPTEKGKLMNAAGVGLKALRLELPITMHRQHRMEAARAETSMAGPVKTLVEEFLKKKG
jgi:hypothetical protein